MDMIHLCTNLKMVVYKEIRDKHHSLFCPIGRVLSTYLYYSQYTAEQKGQLRYVRWDVSITI